MHRARQYAFQAHGRPDAMPDEFHEPRKRGGGLLEETDEDNLNAGIQEETVDARRRRKWEKPSRDAAAFIVEPLRARIA